MFYFTALDSRTRRRPSRPTRRASSRRRRRVRRPRQPGRERADRAHQRRARLPGKVDWSATAANLLTLRYNYTWSEQKNGTFDVDSWGASANATEKDYSHARSRLADLDAAQQSAQRVPLSSTRARTGRAL
jgi:hypothetical protein